MFELIVDLLHSDQRWTQEPYAQCQIVARKDKPEERARICKPISFASKEACLAQLNRLNAEWLATKSAKTSVADWSEWRMECKQVADLRSRNDSP